MTKLTTGQKLGIALIIIGYLAATVYVKLGKPMTTGVIIVGAILLIFDEPAKAE